MRLEVFREEVVKIVPREKDTIDTKNHIT